MENTLYNFSIVLGMQQKLVLYLVVFMTRLYLCVFEVQQTHFMDKSFHIGFCKLKTKTFPNYSCVLILRVNSHVLKCKLLTNP